MEFQKLTQTVIKSGLWENDHDPKYGFSLCIEPFCIHPYIDQFEKIGPLIIDLYTRIINLAQKTKGSTSKLANYLNPILDKGKDGYPFLTDNSLPPIIKVDIVIEETDRLKIVEIDGYNPRGISYAILLNETYQIKNQKLEDTILDQLRRRNAKQFIWLYAERERYYLRSFKYLASLFKEKYDIEVILKNANENDANFDNSICYFIAPWGLSRPNELSIKNKLIAYYQENNSNLIFPLKPWFNNKLILGLPFLNKPFSLGLKEFELITSFQEIKEFLPDTRIIDKTVRDEKIFGKYVIKEGVSSGHKRVFFNSDERFKSVLQLAMSQKKPTYVLQKEVPQKLFAISYYDNQGKSTKDYLYCRFIAHYDTTGNLLNVDLTARNQPLVYGSCDSIQTSCIW